MKKPANPNYLRDLAYRRATKLGYTRVIADIAENTGIAYNTLSTVLRPVDGDTRTLRTLRVRRKTWSRLAAWLDMDSGELWEACERHMDLELC